MNDCVFCKIIASIIPSYKVYEDDSFIVILDRFPSGQGHILIIPKQHIENIYEMDSDTAGSIFKLTARIAGALKKTIPMDGMNILQNNGATAGQSVMHFHIHLIPRHKDDGISIKWNSTDPPQDEFKKIFNSLSKELAPHNYPLV